MNQTRKLSELPAPLQEHLTAHRLLPDDPLLWIQTDMDPDGATRHHVFVLTKTMLLHGCPKTPAATRTLPDSTGWSVDTFSDFTWVTLPVDTLSEPFTDPLISGGILHIRIDGKDTPLAGFTNHYAPSAGRLCGLIGKLKQNETLTDEDLTEEISDDRCPKCGARYPDPNRKICPKCMDKRSLFFRLLSYFKPSATALVAICVLCILNAMMGVVWPYLSGTVLYDQVLSRQSAALPVFLRQTTDYFFLLLVVTLTMVAAKLLQQAFGIFEGRLVARIVPPVVCRIKNEVLSSIQSLSLSFFSGRETGGLMNRVLDDAGNVYGIFIDALPFVLPNLFTIVFSVLIMFQSNWMLALIAVCVMPPVLLVSLKVRPILWHFYSKQHQTSRNMYTRINDNLTGARVVKAFGQEDSEIGRFAAANNAVYDAQKKTIAFDAKFSAMYALAESVSQLLVWGVGAVFVLGLTGKDMTYGTLITFVGYVGMLSGPLNFFANVFRWWSSSMNSAQRIFEIIDARSDVTEAFAPVASPCLNGDIALKNVSFSYENKREVIKDISLHVSPGKMLGIVGKSGAGKSTLVNLITRLYDPSAGHIFLSGYDLRDLSFTDIRKTIAMVSQETYIFRGSIFDNIAYARPSATAEEVLLAATAASAHDFICQLPDGYDTVVGSGGRSLSGGERQRISIARAVLADPKILILDEATAAVDTETEKKIQAALQKLIVGRTTLSIAHRLSTLRDADELIVLEDGKIIEQGTHDALIHQKGAYYKLLQIQSKALAMRGLEL